MGVRVEVGVGFLGGCEMSVFVERVVWWVVIGVEGWEWGLFFVCVGEVDGVGLG